MKNLFEEEELAEMQSTLLRMTGKNDNLPALRHRSLHQVEERFQPIHHSTLINFPVGRVQCSQPGLCLQETRTFDTSRLAPLVEFLFQNLKTVIGLKSRLLHLFQKCELSAFSQYVSNSGQSHHSTAPIKFLSVVVGASLHNHKTALKNRPVNNF